MSANYGDMATQTVKKSFWEHRRPILTQEKPWNLQRGYDIVVMRDNDRIMRTRRVE